MLRYFLIGILGFSLCISISLTQISFALLLLVLVFSSGLSLRKPFLLTPLIAMFAWSLFTCLGADKEGWGRVLSAQSAVLFYFVTALFFSNRETRLLIVSFCLGALFSGILGVIQKISGINFLPRELIMQVPDVWQGWPDEILKFISLRNERAVGTRSHPLTYAESLLPAFFFWLTWLVIKIKEKQRSIGAVGLVLVGLIFVASGMGLSEGRAVLLASVVGSLSFGWFLSRKTFVWISLLLIVTFSIVFSSSSRFRGRVLSVFSTEQGTEGDQASKSIRLSLWSQAFEQISNNPWMGVGPKGMTLQTIDPIEHTPRFWTETHNIYLQVALESGVLGLALFFWLWGCIFCLIFQLKGEIRACMISCVIAFAIAGLTESWVNDKEITMLFWTLIGCSEALVRTRNEKL